MTFSKASRTSVLAALLCLLLMGFAGVSYATVNFAVRTDPTEVINTGMSEVLGSLNFVVIGTGNVTGTASPGPAVFGVRYDGAGTHVEIDNDTDSGIVLYTTAGFIAANARITEVRNDNLGPNTYDYGAIDIAMDSGYSVISEDEAIENGDGIYDYIRLEGVRGRIYTSTASALGSELKARVQSAAYASGIVLDDPSATYQVSVTYPGLSVEVTMGPSLLLCFENGVYQRDRDLYDDAGIIISEAFSRAFVGYDGNSPRVNSYGDLLGDPTNATEFLVTLSDIPTSVSDVDWPSHVHSSSTGAVLNRLEYHYDGTGTAWAIYAFSAANQTGDSDLREESFRLVPRFDLEASDQTTVGVITAQATLYPPDPPVDDLYRPRFVEKQLPVAPDNMNYAEIVRCNCYMLFTYAAWSNGFDTGFAVANTSDDADVFGDFGAPSQDGYVTFYLYDQTNGFVGSVRTDDPAVGYQIDGYDAGVVPHGRAVTPLLSQLADSLGLDEFRGYVIAKAEFQFCHAVSYIADEAFAASAQGYSALIIPDPSIKGARRWGSMGRTATAASDVDELIPAGESLNN